MRVRILIALMLFIVSVDATPAQTTAFTYQGKLSDGAGPASGNYDIQFKLFDTATVGTGTQQGPTITNPSVPVTAGIFTVQLDFGAAVFSGPPRFLEIGVRLTGSPDPYTLLSPRQPVTSTPYSVRSLNSSVADVLSSACVGCVSSTQVGSVSGSAVTGTIPVASVPAGSGNYVQNTTSPQVASNFNISGDGRAGGTLSANAVNATTQYNIGSSRVLSIAGSSNLFAGVGAGTADTTGANNSFFGAGAGGSNTTGNFNSFVGNSAGHSNTSGQENAVFGIEAGFVNTTGSQNSFFGAYAGNTNTTGNSNSFFGDNAGLFNSTGHENSFFGRSAGRSNTTGIQNSFFGRDAGQTNISGSNNTFFGYQAGNANSDGFFNVFLGTFAGNTNTTGDNNTLVGYNADVASGNLSFATAIGAGSVVSTSNTINIGRANGNDVVQVPGTSFLFGPVYFGGVTGMGTLDLCLATDGKLSFCSSSLRYKTNVQTFTGGLDVVRRLRPITFDWNQGGLRDVGFAAEEVERIEPLLATYNKDGQTEGVKYKQLSTVLVNAINEQQSQLAQQQGTIELQQQQNQAQQSQLRQLQQQLDALKKLVCVSLPQSDACK
jgi:hypothetical protein